MLDMYTQCLTTMNVLLSLSWEIGGWSNCTEKCGGGKRTRKVGCWRLLANGPKERVLPKFCSTVLPPKSRERCNTEKCWGKWQKEKWGQVKIITG